jgi:hypothetical protein
MDQYIDECIENLSAFKNSGYTNRAKLRAALFLLKEASEIYGPRQPSHAPSDLQPSHAPSDLQPSHAPPDLQPSHAPPDLQPSHAPPDLQPSHAPPDHASIMREEFSKEIRSREGLPQELFAGSEKAYSYNAGNASYSVHFKLS